MNYEVITYRRVVATLEEVTDGEMRNGIVISIPGGPMYVLRDNYSGKDSDPRHPVGPKSDRGR